MSNTNMTPGPWRACRSHEDFNGPMWDIDPDEQAAFDAKPFVRIEAASGTVAAAHDLFEFKPEDALAIEALPKLLAALKLAEDVLSHRPWSAETWPDGTHPMAGITAIRQALADATGEPYGHCTPTVR